MNLEQYHTLHFIGIGGMGMRALAQILLDKGYKVSGSDVADSPILHHFMDMGAVIHIGHRASNVGNADAIVISSAIAPDNPELAEARERNIPVFHRSDVLAAIFNWGKGIAVAGAHGKSTTSAMIGQIFKHANTDPTIVLGGATDYLNGNSCLGHGKYVIAEADESDGSFLKFNTFVSVVTNIEDDHLDHYGTVENIRKAFIKFLSHIVYEDGAAIVCLDNAGVRAILPEVKKKVITYGFDEHADYQAKNKRYEKHIMLFDVWHDGKMLGTIRLHVPGGHNVMDALAAVVTGLYCGLPFEEIAEALDNFTGVKRRFQTKGFINGVWVIDDYAHHPTEIEATLRAAREIGGYRIVCAFQPHRYSRTKLLQKEFQVAFDAADVLYFTEIYAASERPLPGIDGTLIPKLVKEHVPQKEIHYVADQNDLVNELYKNTKEGDMVITMGAGSIYRVGEKLIQLLKEKGLYHGK